MSNNEYGCDSCSGDPEGTFYMEAAGWDDECNAPSAESVCLGCATNEE